MRLSVESDRCQGHNRCAADAPDLFDVDDDLKAVVLLDPVPADLEAAARSAARNCPERAIAVTDA